MILKLVALLGAVCAAHAHAVSEQKVELHVGHHGDLGHIGEAAPEAHHEYAWAYPAYEFSYSVHDPHTHDMKGHQEHRKGDEVHGMYWLIQPDGYKRTVDYHVDKKSGFKAKVHYEKVHHEKHEEHGPLVEDIKPLEEQQGKIVEYYHNIHHPIHHEHKHVEDHKPLVIHKPVHKPLVHEPKHAIHIEHKPKHWVPKILDPWKKDDDSSEERSEERDGLRGLDSNKYIQKKPLFSPYPDHRRYNYGPQY